MAAEHGRAGNVVHLGAANVKLSFPRRLFPRVYGMRPLTLE